MQARRQDLGGPKTKRRGQKQKGEPHLENTVLDVCSNKGAKRETGRHRFQMGGQAPLAPWLATALFLCNQTLQRFQRFSSCGYLSDRRSGAIEFVLLRSTFPLFGILGDFGLIPPHDSVDIWHAPGDMQGPHAPEKHDVGSSVWCLKCSMQQAFNSYIISQENRARRGMAIINRQCFLLELGKALITPWAQQRLSSPFLPRQLKTLITAVLVYFTNCVHLISNCCFCLASVY